MQSPEERFTLENMLTQPWGVGIDTATPLQRAICRLLSGVEIGDLALHPDVIEAFGGVVPQLEEAPKVSLILSGIRTGKSTMVALAAVYYSQAIVIPDWVRAGDEVRIPIVSTEVDTARATFSHVVETIMSSERLRGLLATDDKGKTIEPKADSLLLRNPCGKDIEVKVTALSRAGSTLTARWFAGMIADEAPRLGSEVDYIRNFDEAMRAARGRVLPGGGIMLGGSPHARIGPVYDMFKKHFGKPSASVVVVRARAPKLNPIYWTPERCAELKAIDPIAHQTDVEADFKDPESALGDSASIEAAMRESVGDVEPVPGHFYVATMDPATRVNTWTFTIVECVGWEGLALKFRVALRKQWVPAPGRTLSPDAVLGEVAQDCRRYGLSDCYTDIASADFAIDLAAQKGLTLNVETGVDMLELGRELMALIRRGLFELPNDNSMREDLQSVRTRTSTNGNVSIVLPKSSGGRHCDFFPSLCLAVKNLPDPPLVTVEVSMQERDLNRELEDFRRRNEDNGDFEQAARGASGF